MTTEQTLFDLPISPEEFGVILPPADLRKIDFSGLDFATARRAIIEYIRTYYPDEFNDFVASNGIIMLVEILASITAKLSLRSDLLANEATLPTSITREAVVNHLALINQRIKRQTPAIVDVEAAVDFPVLTDVQIVAGTSFNIPGPDGSNIIYEIFRAPGDWTSPIIIPAGKRGVIAFGLEGQFQTPATFLSAGGPGQVFTVEGGNILEQPILVESSNFESESQTWKVVTDPIERYGPNDRVVEVNFLENSAIFRFGDDVTGQAPLAGTTIQIRYRVGGGRRGRIGVGQINSVRQISPLPPATAPISVAFRNITPSAGGIDAESIAEAKRRAPRDFALQSSIVTAEDYAQAALSFNHPVFGSIAKSVATIRTGLNANLVEIYALAEGPDSLPIATNSGLKVGLETYFSNLNVLTDQVRVLDGKLRPVDIEMNVVISKNADASFVKERVESAITRFFDINNWEMGQAFYVSNFIEIVEAIDGVAYLDLLDPVNNILPTGLSSDLSVDGIGFDELIVEGKRKTSYYYERILGTDWPKSSRLL